MPPESAANPFMQMAFPAVVLFFIFYFIVFQPEKKRQKERKGMLETLTKNDEVVTSGGIHGTIVNVKTTTVILRVDDSVKFEIDKEAIALVTKGSAAKTT